MIGVVVKLFMIIVVTMIILGSAHKTGVKHAKRRIHKPIPVYVPNTDDGNI